MNVVRTFLLAALTITATSVQSKDPTPGEIAFRGHCIACHSIGCNRLGPKLEDIFGRKAGSLADFNYTSSLQKSGIVWTEKSLDALLRDPGKLVPGTVMASVVRVESATERRDIIEYLRRQDRSIDLCR